MKLRQVMTYLEGELYCGEEHMDWEVDYGYSCDLVSDVLAFVQNPVLLMTGLVHPQMIRTAGLLDIRGIVLVRGKKPSEEIIEMAKDNDIFLMGTKYSLYTASGILFKYGLEGEELAHHDFQL